MLCILYYDYVKFCPPPKKNANLITLVTFRMKRMNIVAGDASFYALAQSNTLSQQPFHNLVFDMAHFFLVRRCIRSLVVRWSQHRCRDRNFVIFAYVTTDNGGQDDGREYHKNHKLTSSAPVDDSSITTTRKATFQR